VTKSSLALVTIVAAIPGAFLAFVLVTSLLHFFSDMPGMFVGLVALTLLSAALAALMPIGVMLFSGKSGGAVAKAPKAEKPAKEKKGKKAKGEPEASDAAVAVVSDPEVEIAAEGDEFFDADEETEAIVPTDEDIVVQTGGQSTGELSVVEGLYTEDNLPKFEAEVSDTNIEVLDAIEEDFDGFDFTDDDDDIPPPTTKKKR
jgi:hypothetical protein